MLTHFFNRRATFALDENLGRHCCFNNSSCFESFAIIFHCFSKCNFTKLEIFAYFNYPIVQHSLFNNSYSSMVVINEFGNRRLPRKWPLLASHGTQITLVWHHMRIEFVPDSVWLFDVWRIWLWEYIRNDIILISSFTSLIFRLFVSNNWPLGPSIQQTYGMLHTCHQDDYLVHMYQDI